MEQLAYITQYLDIARRRQWWIIIPFLLTLLAGLAFAMVTPKIFEAHTLIMIVAQKVPQNYVRAIVSLTMEERLRTIKQQVTSRTNLETIIETHQLFSEPAESKMFLEQKVGTLRKKIQINVTRGTSFAVSFQDKDRRKAMNVTNALASSFITQNLRIREGQAIGTSQFLADELDSVKTKLEQKELLLQKYQRKFMGAMPEQLSTNLSMLGRFQNRLEALSTNLSAVESRKLTIQQQIANMEMMQRQFSETSVDSSFMETDTPPVFQESEELISLKKELSLLRSKYTANHPDVLRLQKMIEKIEKEEADSGTDVPESEPDFTETEPVFDMAGDFLRPQLEQIDLELSNIKAEIKKVASLVELYQRRVEETPKREQEILSLTRDYDNLKSLYDSLLKRKLEADIAVSMEKKQKGEQFRILDPAALPERPIKPNIKKIILLCFALGLGLGGGLAFLIENLNPVYHTPEEVEKGLQLPVLVSIPIRYTERELKDIKKKNFLTYAALGFGFTLSSISIILVTKGVDRTMDFVQNLIAGT